MPEIHEYKRLVREFEKESALKNKRIAELERFVGDVLRLSRYPWLHPERAKKEEQLMVQELLQRAWRLLPEDNNKTSLTANRELHEALTYAQNNEPSGHEGVPG